MVILLKALLRRGYRIKIMYTTVRNRLITLVQL